MWRSIFVHEFIDHDFENFHAIEGDIEPGSTPFTTILASDATYRAIRVRPNQRFAYAFLPHPTEIVGISVKLDIHLLANDDNVLIPILQLGSAMTLSVQPISFTTINKVLFLEADVVATVDGTSYTLGKMGFPYRGFVTLRVDWHTSGQLRLYENNRLIGYHNAAAAGLKLEVTRLSFGLPAGVNKYVPSFWVRRLTCRVMSDQDSLRKVLEWLPDLDLGDDDPMFERCRFLYQRQTAQNLDAFRDFMHQIHLATSTVWNNGSASPSPFSSASQEAHTLALETLQAFRELVSEGDINEKGKFKDAKVFLESFYTFLLKLRSIAPAEFDQLAKQLITEAEREDPCRDKVDKRKLDQIPRVRAVRKLLKKTYRQVKKAQGGSSHG